MVRQSGFQADITGAVNALGELQRIDSALSVPVGQAVQTPVDAPDFATSHGPLEQGVQARAAAPNPESSLFSGEDASFRPLECNLCDRLHMLYSVIK